MLKYKGKFSWEPESAVPVLRDINLKVKRGLKIVVCGKVGAEKSIILGEVSKILGPASNKIVQMIYS